MGVDGLGREWIWDGDGLVIGGSNFVGGFWLRWYFKDWRKLVSQIIMIIYIDNRANFSN